MEPQTKATYAHEIQAQIRDLGTELAEKIVAACGPAWEEIEASRATFWLQESVFNALTQAIRDEIGDEGSRALYRNAGRMMAKNRMFQQMVEALIRILGVSPHTILKLVPKVRATLVKNAGEMTYEKIGPKEARLAISGFPASTWALGTTAIMLAGNLEGAVEVGGATPLVQTRDLDLQGGSCVFHVSWS